MIQVLLAAFKKRFKATPWDVEYKVEVTQWRARMWHEALQEQKVEDEVRQWTRPANCNSAPGDIEGSLWCRYA